eukprot:1680409-Pleurochrysis_carterae.AAC.1
MFHKVQNVQPSKNFSPHTPRLLFFLPPLFVHGNDAALPLSGYPPPALPWTLLGSLLPPLTPPPPSSFNIPPPASRHAGERTHLALHDVPPKGLPADHLVAKKLPVLARRDECAEQVHPAACTRHSDCQTRLK